VLNLTNPLRPTVQALLGAPYLPTCSDVVLVDEYAFVIDPSAGLKVVNLSKAGKPKLVALLPLPEVVALAVNGDLGYLLVGSELVIVNFKNRVKPVIAERRELADGFDNLAVWQNRLLVYGRDAGLQIYDLATPTQPHSIGSLEATYGLYGVAAKGDLIYTAEDRWVGVYEIK